ncbi:MAG: hypothetical protein ACXVDH_07670 [Nocardioides sp.]
MADHFTLDIHPHQLRMAARSLDTIRENLTKHAKTASNEPAAIGKKWTGSAATSVTGEMTAVGGHLSTFATQLLHCSDALTTLAGHYERAQTTLAELNTKWANAESAYNSACDDADKAYNKSVGDLREANGGAMPNRGITMDLDDTRSSAKSSAYTTRQRAQSALDTDFTTLKQHLTTQTTTCGTTLSANIPVKNLGMCTADHPTGLDHSNLLTDLTMVADYEDLEKAAEEDQKAVDAAAPEIKALQDALKGDDPSAIDAALKAIQGHVNGPYGSDYSKAMLDALGNDPGAVAKAVNSLYNNLDWAVRRNEVDPYDQKDQILALTNGLADGLSQYQDADYGKFYGTLSDMDQGAAQLALIASSGRADARQTSGALALQSRWYHYPSGSRELFPEMFQYAYDPPQDMVKILSARSNASALATDLENVDPSKLDFILQSLTLVTRGDRNMTDDEANIQYGLFSKTLEVLKNRFISTSDSDGVPSVALVHALKVAKDGHWGSDDIMQRDDLDAKMLAELTSIINDGDFVRTYIDQSLRSADYPKTLLADLIHDTHADSKKMINSLIVSELGHNRDPKQIATLIGNLMRDDDLAKMGLDWKGAGMKGVEEAINDLIGKGVETLAETNPAIAAVYGPLKAVFDDLSEQQEKIDQAYKGWNDAQIKDMTQHQLAVALYIKAHADDGAFAKDFSDYMNRPEMKGQPDAINRYYEHLMDEGGKTADELRDYADIINGTRDDN